MVQLTPVQCMTHTAQSLYTIHTLCEYVCNVCTHIRTYIYAYIHTYITLQCKVLTVKPVYNDHSRDKVRNFGLCRQVVLVQRCLTTTEVDNEPAYCGLYRQVVFKTGFTVLCYGLVVVNACYTKNLQCSLGFITK